MKTRKVCKCGSPSCFANCQHTPTPWFIVNGYNIEGPNDAFVAEIQSDTHPELDNANAEFIVRAVNSHEELMQFIKDLRSSNVINNNIDLNTGLTMNEKMARLIAKAEGTSEEK